MTNVRHQTTSACTALEVTFPQLTTMSMAMTFCIAACGPLGDRVKVHHQVRIIDRFHSCLPKCLWQISLPTCRDPQTLVPRSGTTTAHPSQQSLRCTRVRRRACRRSTMRPGLETRDHPPDRIHQKWHNWITRSQLTSNFPLKLQLVRSQQTCRYPVGSFNMSGTLLGVCR